MCTGPTSPDPAMPFRSFLISLVLLVLFLMTSSLVAAQAHDVKRCKYGLLFVISSRYDSAERLMQVESTRAIRIRAKQGLQLFHVDTWRSTQCVK